MSSMVSHFLDLMYFLEILVPGRLFKIAARGGGFMEVGHFIERGVLLKLAQQ